MALQPALCSDPSACSTETMRLGPASGLLVDWLETLDPEVVSSCPDLQRKLLFSRRKVTGTWPSSVPLQTVSFSPQRRGGLARPGLPGPGGTCLFRSTLVATCRTGAGAGVNVGQLLQLLKSKEARLARGVGKMRRWNPGTLPGMAEMR